MANAQTPGTDAKTSDSFATDPIGSAEITTATIIENSSGFALASLQISTSASASRGIAAEVANLNQTYLVGLATSTQCVARILEMTSQQQKALDSIIAANV